MTVMTLPETLPRFAEVQHRAATVEALDVEEGTILLRAAPYDVEAQLDAQLWESFAPATFARAAEAPHRVKLFHNHPTMGGALIGHAREVEDRPDGVWVRCRFSNTVGGQEARELAADGTLDQCSVEFRALPDWYKVSRRRDGLHVRHSRAHLLGVALVPHGAYEGAAYVASVRDAQADHTRDLLIAHLRALTS
jgi:HK97 family phage prohead protease